MNDDHTTNQPAEPVVKKAKKVRPPSRSQRWADAAGEALKAQELIQSHVADLVAALEELKEVQQEYADWKDNMPENLSSSPLGEKLEAVCDLDLESVATTIDSAFDELEDLLSEVEGVELPQGFGRD